VKKGDEAWLASEGSVLKCGWGTTQATTRLFTPLCLLRPSLVPYLGAVGGEDIFQDGLLPPPIVGEAAEGQAGAPGARKAARTCGINIIKGWWEGCVGVLLHRQGGNPTDGHTEMGFEGGERARGLHRGARESSRVNGSLLRRVGCTHKHASQQVTYIWSEMRGRHSKATWD